MAAPASSSSTQQRPRLRPDLPLILCNKCGRAQVVERLSNTILNPNRIFFVCPYHQKKGRGCPFFYWVEEYVDLLARLEREEKQRGDVEVAEVEGLLQPEEEDGDVKSVLAVLVATIKDVVALLKVLVVLFGFVVGALLCIFLVLLLKK